jgi:hypothetical protein
LTFGNNCIKVSSPASEVVDRVFQKNFFLRNQKMPYGLLLHVSSEQAGSHLTLSDSFYTDFTFFVCGTNKNLSVKHFYRLSTWSETQNFQIISKGNLLYLKHKYSSVGSNWEQRQQANEYIPLFSRIEQIYYCRKTYNGCNK